MHNILSLTSCPTNFANFESRNVRWLKDLFRGNVVGMDPAFKHTMYHLRWTTALLQRLTPTLNFATYHKKLSYIALAYVYKWVFRWDMHGRSMVTPIALVHNVHPIRHNLQNKQVNRWVDRCVSPRLNWARQLVLCYWTYFLEWMFTSAFKHEL